MRSFKLNSKLVKACMLAVFCITAIAHAGIAGGGDSYQIYLNKKLVLTQHVGNLSAGILSLQLDKSNYNDQLEVIYSHCGVTGKGRHIVVKNDQNKILKEWKFADATGADVSMVIPVKDILELKKNNASSGLNLYYFSSEQLPKGLMLASFKMAEKSVTQRQAESKITTTAFSR